MRHGFDRMDHRWHEGGTAQVAAFAVCVVRASVVTNIVGGRDDLAPGLMLVLMMAEVLLGRNTGLVAKVTIFQAVSSSASAYITLLAAS